MVISSMLCARKEKPGVLGDLSLHPHFVTSVSRDLIIGFQVLGFESVREGQARDREKE
jgi:hypothetical protein